MSKVEWRFRATWLAGMRNASAEFPDSVSGAGSGPASDPIGGGGKFPASILCPMNGVPQRDTLPLYGNLATSVLVSAAITVLVLVLVRRGSSNRPATTRRPWTTYAGAAVGLNLRRVRGRVERVMGKSA